MAPEWRVALGQVLAARGRWADARGEYALVLVAQPNRIDARAGLARSLYALGQVDEALAEASKAIADAPMDYRGHEVTADLLSEQGSYMAADVVYDRAAALANDDMWILVRQAYNAWHAKLYDKVVFLVEELRLRYPDRLPTTSQGALACLTAQAFLAEGSVGQALEMSESCVNLDGDASSNWIVAARVREANTDPSRALEAYRKALALDPSNQLALDAIARLSGR
jgi:Tfp pilus assembly protein PilF